MSTLPEVYLLEEGCQGGLLASLAGRTNVFQLCLRKEERSRYAGTRNDVAPRRQCAVAFPGPHDRGKAARARRLFNPLTEMDQREHLRQRIK